MFDVKNSYVPSLGGSAALHMKRARAKYVPDYENGGLRLASVCEFSRPVFNPERLVALDDPLDELPLPIRQQIAEDEAKRREERREAGVLDEDNVRRSIRRARLAVFDLAVCNKFDLFSTLTFAPENVDRESYEETYKALKIWLGNRVQRKGLKYLAVPEYHPNSRDGSKTAIHFHMLSNSEAVDLIDSGHKRHGKTVFNIPSWQSGFSTAQYIEGNADFCAKYCAKYMTKSEGHKIGGRFYLSGGDLIRPTYVYADSLEELADGSPAKYDREVVGDWGSYKEISYI